MTLCKGCRERWQIVRKCLVGIFFFPFFIKRMNILISPSEFYDEFKSKIGSIELEQPARREIVRSERWSNSRIPALLTLIDRKVDVGKFPLSSPSFSLSGQPSADKRDNLFCQSQSCRRVITNLPFEQKICPAIIPNPIRRLAWSSQQSGKRVFLTSITLSRKRTAISIVPASLSSQFHRDDLVRRSWKYWLNRGYMIHRDGVVARRMGW